MRRFIPFTLPFTLTLCLLTSLTLLGNLRPADAGQPPTREAAIDAQTDMFLYKVNPELDGRKLRSNDYGYIKEWQAIRRAVAQEMKPQVTECAGDQYWELFDYDGINGAPSGRRRPARSFDRIADAIFYSRNPKLADQKISRTNSPQAREWTKIRRAIMVEQPCS